jgi:hypothetical protein
MTPGVSRYQPGVPERAENPPHDDGARVHRMREGLGPDGLTAAGASFSERERRDQVDRSGAFYRLDGERRGLAGE